MKTKRGISSREDIQVVRVLAPLTQNPNAPDKNGRTPIFEGARRGYTEIVKILAPLTENPNASDIYGETPINFTQNKEIFKHLETLQELNKTYKNF